MNINCSLNCLFEQDGKCTMTHITSQISTPHPSCVHFTPKPSPKKQANREKNEPWQLS
ncbi:MAG TPA: hydroxymyristoyl-ACP dehydratase [Clostridiales bacterium]|nr:hydroxymyristoyl-ACP dehydratase [Clostridiales bacterium]